MNGGNEGWRPHSEGGLVDVADCLVATWDIEFEGGIGVAEFLAELGGREDGDVEDPGW